MLILNCNYRKSQNTFIVAHGYGFCPEAGHWVAQAVKLLCLKRWGMTAVCQELVSLIQRNQIVSKNSHTGCHLSYAILRIAGSHILHNHLILEVSHEADHRSKLYHKVYAAFRLPHQNPDPDQQCVAFRWFLMRIEEPCWQHHLVHLQCGKL